MIIITMITIIIKIIIKIITIIIIIAMKIIILKIIIIMIMIRIITMQRFDRCLTRPLAHTSGPQAQEHAATATATQVSQIFKAHHKQNPIFAVIITIIMIIVVTTNTLQRLGAIGMPRGKLRVTQNPRTIPSSLSTCTKISNITMS